MTEEKELCFISWPCWHYLSMKDFRSILCGTKLFSVMHLIANCFDISSENETVLSVLLLKHFNRMISFIRRYRYLLIAFWLGISLHPILKQADLRSRYWSLIDNRSFAISIGWSWTFYILNTARKISNIDIRMWNIKMSLQYFNTCERLNYATLG